MKALIEIRDVSLDNLVLLLESGVLLYSPNALPMASKANSTHGELTSSTLVANV